MCIRDRPGALIAFTGGLGAGKTAFTEGLAEGLGCTDPVSSPTSVSYTHLKIPAVQLHSGDYLRYDVIRHDQTAEL